MKTAAKAANISANPSYLENINYDIPQGTASTFMGEDRIQQGLQAAGELLHAKIEGLEGVTAEIVRGSAYRSIIEFAQRGGFDCIVIGSHKPSMSEYLIGSTAARVVRHAPCTVHVYRDP